jgi:hypothetical protein
MPSPKTVSCPNCGAPVAWTNESRWRPFCSERCKLIDLGAWASESYRAPVTDEADPRAAAPDADEIPRNDR